MSENYAFPDRIRHFRFDRKMTMGDHLNHDPSDWRWYVRADLFDAQAAENARLRAAVAACAGFHHDCVAKIQIARAALATRQQKREGGE